MTTETATKQYLIEKIIKYLEQESIEMLHKIWQTYKKRNDAVH